MGKRGPKPTPTAILERRGSWRANHRPDVGMQESLPELPACPEWVSFRGRQVWHVIGPIVVHLGLLTKEYVPTLGLTVDALAVYVERSKEAAKTPFCYETENGPKEHPIHRAADRARAEMRKWIAIWGLSPADVADISRPAEKEVSALDQFMAHSEAVN